MPEGLSFETAAAITEGENYALVDIKAANLTRGQNVMIYEASGAIGSAAV